MTQSKFLCVLGATIVAMGLGPMRASAEPRPGDRPAVLEGELAPVPVESGATKAPTSPAGGGLVDPPLEPSAQPSAAKIAMFDVTGFGPVDAASRRLVEQMQASCLASMMSREGPSPAEQRQCRGAMAKLAARGKKAVPAIFEALNRDDGHALFLRDRLYRTLATLDDPKIRDVLLAGFERMANERIESRGADLWSLDSTLHAMSGDGPDADVPWESTPIVEGWERWADRTAKWREFREKIGPRSRREVRRTAHARARAERASEDPRVAFRAIAKLVELAPAEARSAALAYEKRALAPEVREAFRALSADASFRMGPPTRS
jgi:hypothetical protein